MTVTSPSTGTASHAQLGSRGLGGQQAGAQWVIGAGGGQRMLTVKEKTHMAQARSPKAQTQHSRSCKCSMTITKTLLQKWPWSRALPHLQRPLS